MPVDGNVPGMLLVVPIFTTAVAALGLLAGSTFDQAERAIYILGPTSVPFFFLTGATYPLDQMPRFVAAFAQLIPSTAGCMLSSRSIRCARRWARLQARC